MSNGRLKVAVVGAGFVAKERHLPFWTGRREVEVSAITDLNAEAAATLAREFNISNHYTDIQQMLEVIRPDIVDVCTPTSTHYPIAIAAIAHGSHVVLEKPMADSYMHCQEMVQAAAAKGVKLTVVHNMLFYPCVMKARKLVDGGAIGKVTGVRVFMSAPSELYLSRDGWVHKLPGGLLGETGPHALYLARAFTGPVDDIEATAFKHSSYPWASADDFDVSLRGQIAPASIRVIHNSNFAAGELQIWGTKGQLKADLFRMTLHSSLVTKIANGSIAASILNDSVALLGQCVVNGLQVLTGRYKLGHDRFLEEFLKSVNSDAPLPVAPEDAAEVVSLQERMVQVMSYR